MESQYNWQTLALGVGIALGVVLIFVLVLNWAEVVKIVATEGLISE